MKIDPAIGKSYPDENIIGGDRSYEYDEEDANKGCIIEINNVILKSSEDEVLRFVGLDAIEMELQYFAEELELKRSITHSMRDDMYDEDTFRLIKYRAMRKRKRKEKANGSHVERIDKTRTKTSGQSR